jgi:hypothetical protein
MAKRSAKAASKEPSRSKRPTDVNQLGHYMVALSTGQLDEEPKPTQSEISRVMAELGRRGGLLGGKARAANLSKKRKVSIAKKAAQARWSNRENAGTI